MSVLIPVPTTVVFTPVVTTQMAYSLARVTWATLEVDIIVQVSD